MFHLFNMRSIYASAFICQVQGYLSFEETVEQVVVSAAYSYLLTFVLKTV